MIPSDCKETSLNINGQQIALKIYDSEAGASPVLALHGWLDNAATFDALAPLLHNIQLIALDFPGHGLSSHRAEGAEYYIWSYVEDVIAIADALNLEHFSLLGHSMGGAIACLLSSLYPARVIKMGLLDTMGPLATAPADAPAQMRKALRQKQGLKTRPIRHYQTEQAAIEARAKKGLKFESASILAKRGISGNEKGYFWHNDQRLSCLNLMSMTEEQVKAFFDDIVCPGRLITSTQAEGKRLKPHKKRFFELFNQSNFEVFSLPGNHHQHLEGQVEQVAELLNEFFSE